MFLLFTLAVKGKPIVEILCAHAPTVFNPIGGYQGHLFDLIKDDGLAGGQGEIVLVNNHQLAVDTHSLVLVKYIRHSLNNVLKNV